MKSFSLSYLDRSNSVTRRVYKLSFITDSCMRKQLCGSMFISIPLFCKPCKCFFIFFSVCLYAYRILRRFPREITLLRAETIIARIQIFRVRHTVAISTVSLDNLSLCYASVMNTLAPRDCVRLACDFGYIPTVHAGTEVRNRLNRPQMFVLLDCCSHATRT